MNGNDSSQGIFFQGSIGQGLVISPVSLDHHGSRASSQHELKDTDHLGRRVEIRRKAWSLLSLQTTVVSHLIRAQIHRLEEVDGNQNGFSRFADDFGVTSKSLVHASE
jgi:hypothetical protein